VFAHAVVSELKSRLGLGVADAGDGSDAFKDEVELGQVSAADLHDEVPCSSGGVESFDLGVAADFAHNVLSVVGSVTTVVTPRMASRSTSLLSRMGKPLMTPESTSRSMRAVTADRLMPSSRASTTTGCGCWCEGWR
jgi:hypothetical protein